VTEHDTNWLDRIPLDAISIAVMAASMFLDGAYLRRYAYANFFGLLCAYVLNCVADVAVNKLTREFVKQRMKQLGKAKRRLTWVLLCFAFASFYFTTVFSWREASLKMPGEPNWLLWSMATFAPTILAGLGLAEAMNARPRTTTKKEPEPEEEETPIEWTPATKDDALRVTAGMNGQTESLTVEELEKRLAADYKTWDLSRSSKYRWLQEIKKAH